MQKPTAITSDSDRIAEISGIDHYAALPRAPSPTDELKFNFEQPATALVFGGSAALVAAVLLWLF